jgi:hypothetical protein
MRFDFERGERGGALTLSMVVDILAVEIYVCRERVYVFYFNKEQESLEIS